MGYMHIDNLYKNTTIMMFKRGYAMEKIHGSSCRIQWKSHGLTFASGGCKHDSFVKLFNQDKLVEKFNQLGHEKVIVYGEGYGGKMQGMSGTYGKELKFVAFEVKIDDTFLNVPNAHDVCNKLGLEFVHYVEIPMETEAIDAQRDADSIQAIRNGMGEGKRREGVVLRPLMEFLDNRGKRVMAKHKRKEFIETKTERKVGDKLKILTGEKAALEWVTDMRMDHVLDKLNLELDMSNTGKVVKAMMEDVMREGDEEVLKDKYTKKAIGTAAAKMYKRRLK